MENKNLIINNYSNKSSFNYFFHFSKYLTTAFLSTILDFGISYFVYLNTSLNAVIASLIGNICGLCLQYVLLMKYVYNKPNSIKNIFFYAITYIIGLSISSISIFILHNILQIKYSFSKISAIIIAFIFNYSIRNKLFTR